MDRVIYLAMTGAKQVTLQHAATAHNLANASTHGFKAESNVFRALPVIGEGAKTRAFVADTSPASDLSAGGIQQTGNPLDIAVRGPGWIAVQGPDGQEAYTRAGQLQLNADGILQTASGLNVMGDGGPIAVPPDQEVAIGKDGTISTILPGQPGVAEAGRIKLVNPPAADLVRGEDGLFRLRNGGVAPADANVGVAIGALEMSNVNPSKALVNMIELSRQFELQLRVLRTAEENDRSATKVLSLSA
ncbi:MAG: flagellar basal-body rod protein FlgF [Hydrogenophilaceae bacterium]|nr:flagellar basal-body rod protein FlgF [Hydrogenophilaceae bacterium]